MKKSSIIIISTAIILMMAAAAFMIWRLYGTAPADADESVATDVEVVEESPVIQAVDIEIKGLDKLDGPFEVKNSATGKTNVLQRKNGSLELLDENGVRQWGFECKDTLCGRVGQIDYYANGKIQYLLISSRTLFLVDRLGRKVEKCKAQLPKDVLLGPDVYDFNSTKKYNIVVLNKDNTIDMYDLQGVKPQKWQGISPDSKILSLPLYLEKEGKSFWKVTTQKGELTYPFYGGEPLSEQ